MRVRTVDGRTADFAAGRYGAVVYTAYHDDVEVKLPLHIFPCPMKFSA